MRTGSLRKMTSPMKYISILGFLIMLGIANLESIDGAGECGNTSPEVMAMKLAPCVVAAVFEQAYVSDSCCSQVWEIGQNPSCLCAVLLSKAVKLAGVNPAVAITIPKRCKFSRPVGRKCGGKNRMFIVFPYFSHLSRCCISPFYLYSYLFSSLYIALKEVEKRKRLKTLNFLYSCWCIDWLMVCKQIKARSFFFFCSLCVIISLFHACVTFNKKFVSVFENVKTRPAKTIYIAHLIQKTSQNEMLFFLTLEDLR